MTNFAVLTKRKILQVLKINHLQDFDVPHNEIFSNRFLEDLEKIWELRYYIPDPNKLEYANCDCAPCSRYKGEIIQGW